MARVAIEQHEFREEPVAAARALQKRQQFLPGNGLADSPGSNAVPAALALGPVFVDLEMRRPDLGERVELEAHARMSRRHDFVGNELFLVADVARQAQARARDVLIGVIHAARHVFVMRRIGFDVALDPALGWSVAGFARNAVGELETFAALGRLGLCVWQSRQRSLLCAG